MELEARVKTLEDKVEMLMAMLVLSEATKQEKRLNIDISKFPTKAKTFKLQPNTETR